MKMMNKIRLKLANMIRWIPGTNHISRIDSSSPIEIIGANQSHISENMKDISDENKEHKKLIKSLITKEEYNPYSEENEKPSFEYVTVSSSFLGLGVVQVKDEIGIKAKNIKPYVNNEWLITPLSPKENDLIIAKDGKK